MEAIGTGLLLVGLLWAGGFALIHFKGVSRAKAASKWPSAAATVLSSEVVVEESGDTMEAGTTWYNPVVNYSYVVEGRELRGSRLRFGNPRSARRSKSEAAISKYVPGSSTTIRYNPEKPEDSVLETGKPSPIYLVLAVFGVPFIVLGMFWNQIAI
jgi:hypothetical protein